MNRVDQDIAVRAGAELGFKSVTQAVKNAAGVKEYASNVPDRARKYLTAIPPANSGHGRNDQTFWAACQLVLGFALTPDSALPLLAEWNANCQPPWTDKELRHKLEDANKQPGPRGYLLESQGPARSKVSQDPLPVTVPWRQFPTDSLPEPVRCYVFEAAEAIGCDPTMVVLPLLAALSAAIGNTRRIRLKKSWSEPAIVWAVVVAESGSLKTPAHIEATKILHQQQAANFAQHTEAMRVYDREIAIYEADFLDWKRKGKKIHEPPPERPVEPVCPRLIASETTIEALADRLQTAPRGLCIVCDELSTWLQGFNQYKGGRGGDVGHWLSMHSAGSVLIDRKTGAKQTIYVERASVNITGSIQPGALRRGLSREHFENGLAARLLLAMPPRLPKHWTEAEVNDETEQLLRNAFERLLSLDFRLDDQGRSVPIDVDLSVEAKDVWQEFYNRHGAEQAELVGDDAAMWAKIEAYAPRLALIVHFVRWAANDPTLVRFDALDATSIQTGIKLADWFGYEARRVYGNLAESDEDREQRELVELIKRKGGRITPRELQRATNQRCRTAEDAEQRLIALAKAGLGTWTSDSRANSPGPRARVFALNGRVAPTGSH
jgi:hypothetical protein